MKKQILQFFKLALVLLLFLQVGKVSAQNNLTIKGYTSSNVTGISADVTVLDQVFGTVTFNGTTQTADTNFTNFFSNLPTAVAGFAGVQVVLLDGYVGAENITSTQADALIAYVKGGGILVGNLEGILVTPNNVAALKYIGEALLCNTVSLSVSGAGLTGVKPAPAFHPANGAMLLNAGATTVDNTASYSYITGVPSENIVYANTTTGTCNSIQVLDFIVPAYPGTISSCGVKGMAFLSGEVQGILLGYFRNDSQSNKNYAQLIYDFLYTPSAMATRRAWSATSTNTNTTCAPALPPCNAGATAPSLSAFTVPNVCPATTANLNSLLSSSATAAQVSMLKWYTDVAHTTAVTDATQAPAGTYYAFYVDTVNNCYSPASAAVTATVTLCPLNITNTCPSSSVDLALSLASTNVVPSGYTLTYHSGTPATTANKLTSSVVTTAGTYYGAYYLPGQDCYTATGRPLVVTITDCCAAKIAPDLTK